MDSVSQLVLGASVAAAAMGRRTAVWKAAVWGGVAGTLPDLDVFIDHGDALANMVRHRAESHSLFWLSVLSPLMALLPALLHREKERFRHWWLAMWLALVTHPLLDAMTVYGTQLLLPFTNRPFGVGSIFIIDPLYTLPLLVGVVVGVARRDWRGLRWVHAGLLLSTAYLAWSAAVQWHVRGVAERALAGRPPQALLVTPTPFNTVLWRVLAMRADGSYEEGFHSLADGGRPIRFDGFGMQQVPPEVQALPAAQRLVDFSHGFAKVRASGGQAWVTDLRMGQEPHYTFDFLIAQRGAGGAWSPVTPRNQGSRGDPQRGLAWIWQRMWGQDAPPPR